MQSIRLEVSVDHPEEVLAAARGGAERLELCSSLVDGGLTPSIGLVEWAVASVKIPVYCMVRPRGGNFCYSDDEIDVMERDIRALQAAGAHGVVFGVLTPARTVNVAAMRRLVRVAHPLCVVFHRAFDLTVDLSQALEDVIASGAAILLTSGGAPSLEAGRAVVAKLIQQAGKRIQIMGGAGVRLHNAARLWDEVPMDTIHASLRSPWPGGGDAGDVGIGSRDAESLYTVREQDVRDLLAVLRPRGN
jgi:copper homeostasis protein